MTLGTHARTQAQRESGAMRKAEQGNDGIIGLLGWVKGKGGSEEVQKMRLTQALAVMRACRASLNVNISRTYVHLMSLNVT